MKMSSTSLIFTFQYEVVFTRMGVVLLDSLIPEHFLQYDQESNSELIMRRANHYIIEAVRTISISVTNLGKILEKMPKWSEDCRNSTRHFCRKGGKSRVSWNSIIVRSKFIVYGNIEIYCLWKYRIFVSNCNEFP